MKSINRKFLFVFLLGIVMLLSLAACGTTDAPAADAPAADAPAAGDMVASFVFTNTGSVEICELYLSPASQDSWGPDQLQDQTIPAGAQFTLNNIPAGQYDARVVGCDNAGESTVQLDIHN
ncbi:MAG: hypothetical protein CO094_09550 [Anaerolineae bacterium CG_4_9_14_3_um_filter_57_17]|nr:hypothetical protein [bacterium]NCT21138.1 hypothetical protein [bacterium]OIO86867.1 MAG: hypothetical protein AUK01_01915 [Anaerolineae bacterium CG2_30_57_67]PJB65676.1 MAG: hypothetical protein CO094_09550 [Anaerolineae bacterium CG_4_9_14_3_um_filter_57_17]